MDISSFARQIRIWKALGAYLENSRGSSELGSKFGARGGA
jgi:hypothetical protein